MIESAGFADTYNMEVENAHCFAVNYGLVVHNCRYGLAARPLKGRVDDTPEWKAFSPEALQADVERLYRNGARKALKQKLTKYGKGNLDPFVG